MTVRTRVAPSPTGDPHVGTAYQALANLAVARKHGGRFVLRIEDTDRARSTAASEAAILRSLRWLGLPWDEGPDCGGPFGPYRQSERTESYREAADRLLADGHAYREHRDEDRGAFAVRLRTPTEGEIALPDALRPGLRKDWASVDDPVILKSDGFPTYHLANVVDDHAMEISHVIRGEEWIASLPKHLLLYEAFGWEPPEFVHLPLLRNKDRNRSKLSKRKNPTSIDYYREAGFLPEALVNFLGLFLWTRAEGEEKFDLATFVENFEYRSVALAGGAFDPDKLLWLNGRHLREDHDDAALASALREWRLNDATLERVAALARPRMRTLGDFGFLTAFLFAGDVPLDSEALAGGRTPDEVAGWLLLSEWAIEDLSAFDADSLRDAFRALADRLDVKLAALTRPLYLAVSGSASSTPLFASMEILGSALTRVRLRRAREVLGGVSKRRERELAALREDGADPA